jgi:hypothetical protein
MWVLNSPFFVLAEVYYAPGPSITNRVLEYFDWNSF